MLIERCPERMRERVYRACAERDREREREFIRNDTPKEGGKTGRTKNFFVFRCIDARAERMSVLKLRERDCVRGTAR